MEIGGEVLEFGPEVFEDIDGSEASEEVIFPNMKFPHLRDLSCSSISLRSLGKMLYPGLRHLELSGPTGASLEQLLAALEPMQNLAELVL